MHEKIGRLTDFLWTTEPQQFAEFTPPSTPEQYNTAIDRICNNIEQSGIVDVTSHLEYRVFNLISFCSVIGSVCVFLTSIWNPKLRQHPYQLVSVIALIDATYFLLFNTLDEVCVLDLHKVFAQTVYFSSTPEDQYRALILQLKSAIFMFKTFFITSFFLNAFLCIDLYLTVKSPF